MKFYLYWSLLICFALIPAWPAQALESYSLVDQDCQVETGLIVNIDQSKIYLLTLQGRLAELPRSRIKHILVYNTLNNPISELDLSGELGKLVRDIHLAGEEKLKFTGWSIRFFQDFIVFYDIEGKTHIQDVDKIVKIETPKKLESRLKIERYEEMSYSFGNYLPECSRKSRPERGNVQPTRMISNQIKVGKFLSEYQNGFDNLNRFQSRSAYYARPFLFDKETKLGISLSEYQYYYRRELSSNFPFYIQWSGGQPYNPQAFFSFGSKPVEFLPNVEPLFSVRTEIKAHLFSASFIGNPLGFSQGDDFIIQNRFNFEEFFIRRGKDDLLVVPHFNQLALTGLEWGPHSFSGGLYYPVYGINGNGVFREVLSTKASIMVRYLHTTQFLKLRLIHSAIQLGSDNPTNEDIRLINSSEMQETGLISPESMQLINDLEKFSFRSRFFRAGFDLDIYDDVMLGIDQVVFYGNFREVMLGEEYRLGFDQYITSFRLGQHFGKKVSLKGYLNYFQRAYQSRSVNGVDKPTHRRFSLVWEIEFVL